MSALFAFLFAAVTYSKLDYLPDAPLRTPKNISPSSITICLDPGHGGEATGAVSYSGKLEKDLNLALAFEIRRALTNAGFKVVMTREDDRDVDLFARPAVAIMNDCDLFISVHHNAPGPGGDPMKLRYSSVHSWNPIGKELADAIAVRWKAKSMHSNFVVTRNPCVPSVLLEADFITHPKGDKDSSDPSVRRIRAARVVAGVFDWLRIRCKGKNESIQIRQGSCRLSVL